jgi:hypothetical protein
MSSDFESLDPFPKMLEWPENHKIVPVHRLLNPLRAALEFAYRLEPQNEGIDIPYEGYTFGQDRGGLMPPPDVMLTAEQLAEDEDMGRDAAYTILNIALLLGIEQGRRLTYEDIRQINLDLQRLKDKVDDLVDATADKSIPESY